MATDEKIRLLLEIVGEQGIDDLRKKYAALSQQGGEVAAALSRGEIEAAEAEAEFQRLATSAKNLEKVIGDLERAQRDLAAEEERAATSAEREAESQQRQAAAADRAADAAEKSARRQAAAAAKATGATRDSADALREAQFGAITLSRSLQDLAQGGFPAILNNLEQLGTGIPALLKNPAALVGSLGAALTIAGVAAYQFGPPVFNFFKGLAEGSNEVPKAADALGRVEGRLKDVVKQLDAYREKQRLTNSELADYNKLSAEQVALEKAKADEIKRQADLEKLRKLEAPGAEEQRKERGEIVQGAVAGKQGEVESSLAESMSLAFRQKLFRERDTLEGQIGQEGNAVERQRLQGELAKVQARLKKSIRGEFFDWYKSQAERILAAAAQGSEADIGKLLGVMGGNERFAEGGELAAVRRALETATPADQRTRRRAARRSVEQGEKLQRQTREKQAMEDAQDALSQQLADDRQKEALETLTKGDVLKGTAATAAKEGRAKGLETGDLFESVRERVLEAIQSELRKANVPVAGQAPQQAAGTIARTAVAGSDQEAARAARKAETAAGQVATGFLPAARRKIERPAALAIGTGSTDDQVEAEVRRQAGELLAAGGVPGAQRGAAAAEIAQRVMAEIGRQIAEQMANQAQAGAMPNRQAAAMQIANGAGGGFKSVAPSADPGPGLDRVIGAVERGQAADGATMSAMGAISARIAAIEQRDQARENFMNGLGRRAQQMAPTALNSGSFP